MNKQKNWLIVKRARLRKFKKNVPTYIGVYLCLYVFECI